MGGIQSPLLLPKQPLFNVAGERSRFHSSTFTTPSVTPPHLPFDVFHPATTRHLAVLHIIFTVWYVVAVLSVDICEGTRARTQHSGEPRGYRRIALAIRFHKALCPMTMKRQDASTIAP
jgi:hypothetical protein